MLRRLQFNLWYLRRPPWDSGISPPELLDFIVHHPPGRAVDLGCGSGTNVLTLAEHGWDVTGVDYAPAAVRIARKKLRRADVDASLVVGDVTRLTGITGPFDLALDLGCFHGIENRRAYLTELERLLVPGGYWLMYAFFRSGAEARGSGLDDAALGLVQAHGFRLLSRADGLDKNGRPSAWFLYQRAAEAG